MSEAHAQSQVRLEAAAKGLHLFRNNVGVLRDENGRPVRFGLANDSAAINAVLKSSDLVGWRPVTITLDMVGQTVAVFTCREIKTPGWTHPRNDHERAQQRWIDLVNTHGGDAAFATGPGSFDRC